ncbi:hypothetical protein M405DRAFT_555123 [Rhizopogon salebrosus TDB-379]|nr:hypothetical protein M405DRAFT_555123 [Rhizopogon salebrosus TDB-379]
MAYLVSNTCMSLHITGGSALKSPKAKFGVMSSFALDDNDSVSDLTCHITKLGSPTRHGSFSQVYQSTMVTSEGKIEVAVKVLLIDPERSMAKIEKGVLRELKVWLRLRHPTIVPLLGIAHLESPLPALISQWMPSGTLYIYLEKRATTLTALAKDTLAKGVADGLKYRSSIFILKLFLFLIPA